MTAPIPPMPSTEPPDVEKNSSSSFTADAAEAGINLLVNTVDVAPGLLRGIGAVFVAFFEFIGGIFSS